MSREFSRSYLISEIIMREIAQMIQFEISDPRIGMVTVSHVNVTSDVKYAKVFITRLNHSQPDQDSKECLKCLSNAVGFFRKILAKRIKLRAIPKLFFFYDDSLEHGFYIDDLISKANNIAGE